MNKPDPKHQAWLGHMKIGSDQFKSGDLKQASLSFNKAIRLFPDRVEAWINLGSSLLQSGQIEDAAKALNKAVSMNPQQPVSHMLLGDAFRLLGRRPNALQCYRNAVTLQRSPQSLNKLACELRASGDYGEAEKVYLEALELNPEFALAQINRATLSIARQDYEVAQAQLDELTSKTLSPEEQRELDSCRTAMSEYFRLKPGIDAMIKEADLTPLESLLADTPESVLATDDQALRTIKSYHFPEEAIPLIENIEAVNLPKDWPEIEALHMIPYVNSVDEYVQLNAELEKGGERDAKLQESLNMVPAIHSARKHREAMKTPLLAELHLRHWHALCCDGVEGIQPGHFKYTQNWAGNSPTLKRVDPALTSGTIRYAIGEVWTKLPPGLLRAAIALLIVGDLHPYADGNGRVALIWMNRELEAAGLMPALFTRKQGFMGKFGKAMEASRTNGGNLIPVMVTIVEAQQYARQFIQQLASKGG